MNIENTSYLLIYWKQSIYKWEFNSMYFNLGTVYNKKSGCRKNRFESQRNDKMQSTHNQKNLIPTIIMALKNS